MNYQPEELGMILRELTMLQAEEAVLSSALCERKF
jgi:hypothetical protein